MVCAKSGAEEVGTTIFNATLGGRLEIFPRADFQELVRRPALPAPNDPVRYLLSRALERAGRYDLKTVAVDAAGDGTDLDAIIAASPLRRVDDDDADIVVTDRPPGLGGEVSSRRVLVLPGESVVGESSTTPEQLMQVLVDCLTNGRSAFVTRSLLEFSSDGESLAIPTLGRSAQLAVDTTREYGVDDLGTLDASRATRWAYGRSLSLDQLAELAATIVRHQHSVGVVDGYVYVQSRWKPTEPPAEVLTRRQPMEGRHLDGLRP
jgi:hypothetical protein